MAKKLVDKYPDVLDGINAAAIRCVAVTNKEPKDNKPMWELRAVPMPIRLDCPFSHYVIVNMADWGSMLDKHRALLIFDVLCSISRDGEEKVVPFDIKDHAVILRTVGVDYMKRTDVPDIINDNIQWKKEA